MFASAAAGKRLATDVPEVVTIAQTPPPSVPARAKPIAKKPAPRSSWWEVATADGCLLMGGEENRRGWGGGGGDGKGAEEASQEWRGRVRCCCGVLRWCWIC